MNGDGDFITTDFTVVIDTREQAPWLFQGFRCDASQKSKRKGHEDDLPPALLVKTEVKTLSTGDYSIVGLENSVCVERKSLEDLYGTLGSGRDRFERELERMSQFDVAHVVVEASWPDAIRHPPSHSRLSPVTVFRSINAWEQEFPNIHWQFMGERVYAEHKCFRILDRYWKQRQKTLAQGSLS